MDQLKQGKPKSSRIKCGLCEDVLPFRKYHQLEDHVEKIHGVKVVHRNLSFPSEDKFKAWLKSIETDTSACFIKLRGIRRSTRWGLTTVRYSCNRSGIPLCQFPSGSEGSRKRQLKCTGYRKTGSTCTARVTVKISESGTAVVDFCETHFGHDNELKYLPIPRDRRNELATRIAAKVPIGEILKEIEDSSAHGRDRLITKQDLRNIARRFGLQRGEGVLHHKVETWVQQETDLGEEDSCLILYKPSGLMSQEYAHTDLKKDDFLLGIMMKGQINVLKKFHGERIVMMDSTPRINARYELSTLIVLDDSQQWFPAAFFISNRQDFTGIQIFLEHVKKKVGIIEAKTFMSDMTETFFNAWNCVMGPCHYKLFCSWHVFSAWQMKINATIKDIKVRKSTYAKVHALLSEMDEEAFERMLSTVIKSLCSDIETSVFGEYFANNYVRNRKQWAYCYRKDAGLNTNMHLEQLHRAIKRIFFKGKTVKRLDVALNALKKFVRKTIFDRIHTLEKERVSYSIRQLRKRHATSLTMSFKKIIQVGDGGSWTVISEECSKTYVVERVQNPECASPCQLKCHLCKTCFHEFTCSCLDYRIHKTICTHVHLVCRYLKMNNVFPLDDPSPSDQVQLEAKLLNSLRPEPALPQNQSKDFETQKRDSKKSMTEYIQELYKNMETSEQIAAMEKHMKRAESIVCAAKRSLESSSGVENRAKTRKNT